MMRRLDAFLLGMCIVCMAGVQAQTPDAIAPQAEDSLKRLLSITWSRGSTLQHRQADGRGAEAELEFEVSWGAKTGP